METKNNLDFEKKLTKIRAIIDKHFTCITDLKDLPKKVGGSMIEKVFVDPKVGFHFLEYIFSGYTDLDKVKGLMFIDDKVTWEFYIKTKFGCIRIYDWKGHSISIGTVDQDASNMPLGLRREVGLLKKIIEENVTYLRDFQKASTKKVLNDFPLENFIHAFISLKIQFDFSLEQTKAGHGLLECLILYVSLVDALLRYAILLNRINRRKSRTIEPDLRELFQQVGNSYISEREIHKIAKCELDFLNHDKESFFTTLSSLYDERNKAVHRYAITNFQYIEILDVIKNHFALDEVLEDIIKHLEQEQAELGVGFVRREHLEISSEELVDEIDQILRTKVNPHATVKVPERNYLFSDKYRSGVNPKFKKIFDKYKKQIKKGPS